MKRLELSRSAHALTNNIKNDIKILLVSDPTKFALTDVYYGYQSAFQQLGIDFYSYPFHHFLGVLSPDICYQMMHSYALRKDCKFTHVVFIGGLNIPNHILESLYHVKTVIIATEDPHTFDPMKDRLDKIDYYFSNEKTVGTSDKWDNTYYCPTAADTKACGKLPITSLEKKYLTDICFVGAMYPNRAEMMEAVIPFVQKHDLNFKILGHPHYLDKESPLWEYVPPDNYEKDGSIRTIPHEETVKYYNGAKVTLNFFRDLKWNPRTNTGENQLNSSQFDAWSLNPRAYEVPACGGFQLLESTRKEAKEVFAEDEVGFFEDADSMVKQLEHYLIGKGRASREAMRDRSLIKVMKEHTYINRALYVLEVLSEG